MLLTVHVWSGLGYVASYPCLLVREPGGPTMHQPDKICSHEFIRGYPFFYFYCAIRYVEAEPLGTKTNVFSK